MNVIRADARRGGAAQAIVSSHPTTAELTGGALALGRPDALLGGADLGKAIATARCIRYYGKKLLDPAFTTDLVQGRKRPDADAS